jgi:AraC family transcriptional regulator
LKDLAFFLRIIYVTHNQNLLSYLSLKITPQLARDASYQPAQMAALCFVSLRQLERFFRKVHNKTPGEWIREVRCDTAKTLISSGWPIKVVVQELHFSDGSHLCRDIKRIYGVRPRSLKERLAY